MCLPDGQRHSGGNGTPPRSQRDGEIEGELPGVSIRPVIFLAFSPHEALDDRLIEVPITSIRILNDALHCAVSRKPFAVGCVWLGYGGTLTIHKFSYLVQAAR